MVCLSLRRVAIGALAVRGLLAMTNCAEPTQIVVEVFTDACPLSGKPQVIHSTGIAVGTADNIESRRPSSTHEGCESATGVGTLVIYPSGAKDAEVAIKVLGGVESTPDRCDPPGYAGCIVHRRMLRFIPNVTQHATVRLTLACLNRECAPGKTCDNGACVADRDLLDDGGTSADAERIESGVVPPPADAGPADGADPLCVGCKGDCVNGTCTVDCSKVTCAGELCAPLLPCKVLCPKADNCANIACTTNQKCSIACAKGGTCGKIVCKADDCQVDCIGDDACNTADIALAGATRASLNCQMKHACRMARTSCTGKDCTLTCNPSGGPDNACPQALGPCVPVVNGACDGWNQPNSNN
ncbi:hypothetical protein BH11MYX4_BH11MYX4_52910 [soil metagenome]